VIGHQGGKIDIISGLINFDYREFSTSLGRWVQMDPMGAVDGSNLYQAYRGSPIGLTDAFGLWGNGGGGRRAPDTSDWRVVADPPATTSNGTQITIRTISPIWGRGRGGPGSTPRFMGWRTEASRDYLIPRDLCPDVVNSISRFLRTQTEEDLAQGRLRQAQRDVDVARLQLHLVPFGQSAEDFSEGNVDEGIGHGLRDGLLLFGPGLVARGARAAGAAASAGRAGASAGNIANPVPTTFARVVPGGVNPTTLGMTDRVFVTDASLLRGLNPAQIADGLEIPANSSFKIIEFCSKDVTGIGTPIRNASPGFLGRGVTSGGFPEFTIPNGPIPPWAVIREVPWSH
jgi:RHS repeat-associated protein